MLQPASPPSRPPSVDTLPTRAPALARVLGEVRRRAATLEFLRCFGWGLVASCGVLFLAGLLLAFKLEFARPLGWGLAALLLLASLLLASWRAWRARGSDALAARLLGRLYPEEASDLLSAVELAHSDSSELASAHLARMATRAPAFDPRPALPRRPALLALGAGALLVAGHLSLFLAAGGRTAEAWAFLFFRPSEASTLFAPEPIAGDVTLTYRYPAYMNRPSKTVAGTAGDITAPKGTVVEISARADRDVAKALAVYADSLIPLRIEGRELSGELIVGSSGTWRLRYDSERGRILAEGPARPVVVEPDAPPQVSLSSPEAELEVDGHEKLDLVFEASDDYGLSELVLVFSRADGVEQRKPLQSFASDRPRRHRGESVWDIGPLALGPGERVTYRIEALDNDTLSGPKVGASATQVLKVFSRLEHHAEILRRAQELWERLVSGLADRLEEPPAGEKGERVDEQWRTHTTGRDQVLSSVAAAISVLASELSEDERSPPEIGRALAHVSTRLTPAVRRTMQQRRILSERPSAAAARNFSASLASEIREEEQAVLYLEDLFDRQRLLDLAELSRELQKARKDLTSLVEEFKNAPSEEARQKLMSEVARMKERVHELFKRMQELQKQIQDRHLNAEAESTMSEGKDLLSELDEIQQQLSKGETDKALEALENLQKQLEKMEKEFNEGAGETDPEMAELGRELGQIASELMDVEAEQQALKSQTEKLQQEQLEAQKKQLEKLGADFVKKQRERVSQAVRELEKVDYDAAEAMVLESNLQSTRDRLAQLDQALQGQEFVEALEQAVEALAESSIMSERFQNEARVRRQYRDYRSDSLAIGPAAEHSEKSHGLIGEVERDLRKLMRETTQKQMSPEDRARMQELAQKQGEAQQRTSELQQRLEELGQKAPLFGPAEQKILDDAQKHMGEAGTRLGQGEPRGASTKQGEALEKLQAMREAMQEAANQGGGSGGGIPMPFASSSPGGQGGKGGRGTQREKVEIPSADQSRAPEAFRKDILDAMKDSAPEGYRERVRDYYEDLVK